MMDSLRRGQALPLVALLLFGGSCQGPYPLTDPRTVAGLVERTVPPGGTLVNRSGPVQNESGIRAQWEIATGMTWDAYVPWVRDRLGKDFSTGLDARSPVIFRKVLPADVVTLRVERLSKRAPLHVRVSFSAAPF